MTSSYKKGRDFEWLVANELRNLGWYVVRAAKSGFPDLIAFRKGRVFCVECKFNQKPTPKIEKTIKEWRNRTGISVLLLCRYKAKPSVWVTKNIWFGNKEENTQIIGKRNR